MLIFLTVAIMIAVAYCFVREGVLTALCMTVNVVLAGVVAFEFFEPLADEMESMVKDTFLDGTEDALCLALLCAVTLGVLRAVTNNLASSELRLHPRGQQAAAAVLGLLCGYLLAG